MNFGNDSIFILQESSVERDDVKDPFGEVILLGGTTSMFFLV